MARLSAILRSVEDNGLMFWCPGCDGAHCIYRGEGAGPRWGWDGNVDAPTFTPSIMVRGVEPWTTEQYETYKTTGAVPPEGKLTICHSFIAAGQIQFLPDCTHALAGQTVALPEFDDG